MAFEEDLFFPIRSRPTTFFAPSVPGPRERLSVRVTAAPRPSYGESSEDDPPEDVTIRPMETDEVEDEMPLSE